MDIRTKGRWLIAPLLSVASLAAASDDLRLVDAVKNDDVAAVRSLLTERVDVNTPSKDGATALAWAAHRNNLQAADLLIRAGANVNAANAYGVTALSLACTNGSAPMIEKLLKAGANPNAARPSGETPLMTAARSGSLEAVKLLLAHEADVNAKESVRAQTPLMWALAEKQTPIAKVLVENGADVHARSKGGLTPLMFAAQEGDVEAARTLLTAGADVNEATPTEGSALAVASANGHEPLALFLLEKGANPNLADQYGMTPLHYVNFNGLATAASVGYTPDNYYMFRPTMWGLTKALLAKGANPNARIAKLPKIPGGRGQNSVWTLVGATPFMLAAAGADAELMRAMAAAGADPKITAGKGMTSLMAAIGLMRAMNFAPVPRSDEDTKASFEAVKVAVELGVDVNARTQIGDTALFGAAYLGGTESVTYLVAHGADADVENMHGQTPLSIALMQWGTDLPRLHDDTLRPRHVYDSTAEALVKGGAGPIASATRPRWMPKEAESRGPAAANSQK